MRFHISLRTGQVSKRECYTVEIKSEIAVDGHFVFTDVNSRSSTNADVVSMIGTIVFKETECTSGNVKRL